MQHATALSGPSPYTSLSGMLDSESEPRNSTFSVSHVAIILMSLDGSAMRFSNEGSSLLSAVGSEAKVLTTFWMGNTLHMHVDRSGRDAVQFSSPLLMAGFKRLPGTTQHRHTRGCKHKLLGDVATSSTAQFA